MTKPSQARQRDKLEVRSSFRLVLQRNHASGNMDLLADLENVQ